MKCFDEFVNHMHSLTLDNKTRAAYISDVRDFCEYAKNESAVLCADGNYIADYITRLRERGRSESTVCRSLSSLKHFYSFLCAFGIISESPINGISPTAPKRNAIFPLSRSEISRLLAAPSRDTPKGIRDGAMLELMYGTGISVSELVALDIENVSPTGALIPCNSGNSRKLSREIRLHPRTADKLDFYISGARKELSASSYEKALFLNAFGNRITRQGIWKLLREYAVAVGIERDVTPKLLRASFAAHLLDNGISIESLSLALGHKNVAATKAFSSALSEKANNLSESDVLKFHPFG